ncbi:MAG: hypothetical protein XXXJIFNMEKO3_00450 [Candidatus Erwinia impunctatus]|nr:hypothetical protein XXXJIFNMEKO_00450 [Culicoides impunctatus]
MPFSGGLKHDMLLGCCCLPAVIIIFIWGFTFHHIPEASVAANGALTLAFGANKRWEGSFLSLLSVTALGLTLSTWLGCLAGNSIFLYIGGAIAYAALYIALIGIDSAAWWMVLQWAIIYLVSGYYSGDIVHASQRAGLVLSGSVLQIFFLVAVFRRYAFHLKQVTPHLWFSHFCSRAQKYRRHIHFGWSVFWTVIAMAVAAVGANKLQLPNGYWSGMTLLLCLRNDYRDSFSRIHARIFGTLAGSLLAAELIVQCDSPLFLVTGFILFGYIAITFSYSLIARSYLVFTFFITMMMIFMLACMGISQTNVASERLVATLLGGVCALIAITLTRICARYHLARRIKIHHQYHR